MTSLEKRSARNAKRERKRLNNERHQFVLDHTFEDDRGLRRCKKHGKVYYGKEGKAHAGLIEYLRHPQSDPGAVTYGCNYTRGWHIGHPGGWKSLGRLMDEAEGIYRMADAS